MSALERLMQHPALGGLTVEQIVQHGNPFECITDMAPRVDLVVMGTGGETGLSHLIFGNNAEKVFRHCPCKVLSVRGPEVCALPEFV